MAKRTNKSSSVVVVPVVEVSEVSETVLSDVLGPVSEERPSEVSEAVSEVVSEVLSEVSSETVAEVVETVPVEVPNDLLRNFNRWLQGTLVRKSNGNKTANGKTLGRKPSVFTKTLSLVKLPKTLYFVPSKRGRPTVGSVLTSITVSKDLVYTPETQFEVDLVTNDWKIIVVESEVQKAA